MKMAATPEVLKMTTVTENRDNEDSLEKFVQDIESGDSSALEEFDIQEDLETNKKLYDDSKAKCKWSPTSMALLEDAEKRILKYVKTPYKGHYVNIGKVVGKEDNKIWTLSFTENGKEKTPLVLLHGMASGVGFWGLNLDALAADRYVYAFDMLGFGRSSRPKFSSDSVKVENQLVESIEEWAKQMQLERFVMVGHSMGGFLVTSYAMKYPHRVAHLILADPWGFPKEDPEWMKNFPLRTKLIAFTLKPFNPLMVLRATGRMGPKLVKKFRSDLIERYAMLSGGDDSIIADYIYHCNAQTPSGETAFHTMSNLVWAKNPMENRLSELSREVPMTIIYGSNSWVRQLPDEFIRYSRPSGSFVNILRILGAGHHVMADDWLVFNNMVLKASRTCDNM